jgi:hypothetical protein
MRENMGAHADFSVFSPCFAGQAGRQVFWGGAAAPPFIFHSDLDLY